jgi:hypothetical protein
MKRMGFGLRSLVLLGVAVVQYHFEYQRPKPQDQKPVTTESSIPSLDTSTLDRIIHTRQTQWAVSSVGRAADS